MAGLGGLSTRTILEKCICEFLVMMLFIFIGVGTAMAQVQATCPNNGEVDFVCTNGDLSGGTYGSTVNPRVFQIAFAFGNAIMVLVFAAWSLSGGHVNCAVTTALMVSGHCPVGEGVCIMVAQFLGSFTGAALVAATIPKGSDGSGGTFGTNSVADGFSQGNAFAGEFMMTFLLLFVIYHTAVFKNSKSGTWSNKVKNFAPVAIGMSVFCAHCVLIPITGCSINPTRSLGPLLVGEMRGLPANCNAWEDLWIFFLAPEAAALVAGFAFPIVWAVDDKSDQKKAREANKDEVSHTKNPVQLDAPAPAAPTLPTMGASLNKVSTVDGEDEQAPDMAINL